MKRRRSSKSSNAVVRSEVHLPAPEHSRGLLSDPLSVRDHSVCHESISSNGEDDDEGGDDLLEILPDAGESLNLAIIGVVRVARFCKIDGKARRCLRASAAAGLLCAARLDMDAEATDREAAEMRAQLEERECEIQKLRMQQQHLLALLDSSQKQRQELILLQKKQLLNDRIHTARIRARLN